MLLNNCQTVTVATDKLALQRVLDTETLPIEQGVRLIVYKHAAHWLITPNFASILGKKGKFPFSRKVSKEEYKLPFVKARVLEVKVHVLRMLYRLGLKV